MVLRIEISGVLACDDGKILSARCKSPWDIVRFSRLRPVSGIRTVYKTRSLLKNSALK